MIKHILVLSSLCLLVHCMESEVAENQNTKKLPSSERQKKSFRSKKDIIELGISDISGVSQNGMDGNVDTEFQPLQILVMSPPAPSPKKIAFENAFENASAKTRSDEAIVSAVVALRGADLEFASPELRANENVILKAVQNDGMALKHVKFGSKSHKVVNAALNQNAHALVHAPGSFKSDAEVVFHAVMRSNHFSILDRVHQKLWSDPDILLTALSRSAKTVERMRSPLRFLTPETKYIFDCMKVFDSPDTIHMLDWKSYQKRVFEILDAAKQLSLNIKMWREEKVTKFGMTLPKMLPTSRLDQAKQRLALAKIDYSKNLSFLIHDIMFMIGDQHYKDNNPLLFSDSYDLVCLQ